MKPLLALFALLLLSATARAQPVLQTDLPLKYLVQTGAQPAREPLVIFLHGYGSNEEDLFTLRQGLPADYTYLSARAPLQMSDGGYKWFSSVPGAPEYDAVPEDLASSEQRLVAFVTQAQRKYGVDARHTYLIGFSQGAIISYQVLLKAPGLAAGFAALSGKMLPALRNALPHAEGQANLKVFIGHGTADSVLPYATAPRDQALLGKLGIEAQFHAYPSMDHTVSQRELNDLSDWLRASVGD
ncbi:MULTISPECIES: alpha/beta hydrolase [unclassified Pseudomonas]|uniref:alpha/beta hydrolase n=1 Tax=unclassified Pseudomonas TaxID=196821 RepID=UPI000BC6B7F5|nr:MULTISPECIES: phospholipase [unclassified Pseudomonas]PVZ19503.1 phospholipase/carboxylesterase [Pseudomonas sp. URIL14HWK12:I12]PVZ22912.1 phospholipase/carboxylesterase [Pseudomonas sp. URIL14HWK12:I10]PVZ37458.1 phospholipase/carboxylesterase [Pseudomonas sp. URIL14HWK12:I11]SNZ14844.1 phospholipase/carboxylesterase [Pseudomonas sp. URIL14HWK12:I9]